MDLLDFVIRVLGLALQVFGLLLTWTGVRSLMKLRRKIDDIPLMAPRPQGFHTDKPPFGPFQALGRSETLTEHRFETRYRELRFLTAVMLQRLTARAGWGVVVVGIGTVAGTLSTEIAELLGALYRLLIT